MASTKTQLSIGEVLKALRHEFSDVSISKIRFLETEGLVDPERTPSGYRKFNDSDIARLRYILRLQRDHFMPLKIIRKRLQNFDPADLTNGTVSASEGQVDASLPKSPSDEDGGLIEGGLSLSWEEFLSASGLSSDEIAELEEFGLVEARLLDSGEIYYNEDDLQMAKIAREFAKFGIHARHLKMYKNFAEKEVGLFEQVIPAARTSPGESTRGRTQSLLELAKLSRRMKQVMLRSCLRDFLNV
ncbi:MAG: transcriptional regulator FtsR [Actinomycetota bacterium]